MRGGAVSERREPLSRSRGSGELGELLSDQFAELLGGPDEPGSGIEGFWPLGRAAQDEEALPEDGRLLLDATGVRDEQGGTLGEGQEDGVADGTGHVKAGEQLRQAEAVDAFLGTGMEHKEDRGADVGQLDEDPPEALGVVNVLGSVQGDQNNAAGGSREALQELVGTGVVTLDAGEGLDDRVAGQGDALVGDTLATEVADVAKRRGAAQVGQVIDDDTVVFLGHAAVVAA